MGHGCLHGGSQEEVNRHVLSCCEDSSHRSVFVHVALPGQELGAADKPVDWIFPSMKVIFDLCKKYFIRGISNNFVS